MELVVGEWGIEAGGRTFIRRSGPQGPAGESWRASAQDEVREAYIVTVGEWGLQPAEQTPAAVRQRFKD